MAARFSPCRLALLVLSAVLSAPLIHAQEVEHRIVFTFDYDFSVMPACSPTVTKACLLQFVFYDISQGVAKRVRLGSIPAPSGATGLVKGISGKSDSLVFNSGKHIVAVSAQKADGSESDLTRCTTMVRIP